jgi:hypothetical protein
MTGRCKECKHWTDDSKWTLQYYPDRAEWKDCDHPDRKAVGTGHNDGFGSDLSCAPDFGCIQFEAQGSK